ncbi:ABC transporter permease subunit [Microbacterium immunditiarum]|uniref:Raffinose/stachyose/melibiose transport system permease protein n=1 Tax=Microbacterium immunditiarum TaxID=337480 RepID=A0A7Y9KHZ8_9MICO|nr:raffinose/stachyose/melibiose transport system permease protein [Microbacterium immunditiarum]
MIEDMRSKNAGESATETLVLAPRARMQSPRRRPFRVGGGAFWYVLPAATLILVVIYLGVAYTGYVSVLDWDGLSPNPEFAGIDNYLRAFTDPVFWECLAHSAVYAVIVIPVNMAIGLTMAILLTQRVFLSGVIKVIMFVPVVLSSAAIAVSFRELLGADGMLNQVLRAIGLGGLAQPWLAQTSTALYAIALITVWATAGLNFILYQAALSQIDEDTIEAAQLDGAGKFRIVRSVIFPQLAGTHATLILLGVIGALRMFDIVFLTTRGGPAGATEFLATYIYRQTIDVFNAGYASALSILLLLIALVLTVVQLQMSRRRSETVAW